MDTTGETRDRRLFICSVIGWIVLHAVLAAMLPISGDEAYFWDCARHPDWAYFDQPGLMIWPITVFRPILGDHALAVRAPALIASALIAWMLLGLIRRLGGGYREAAAAYAVLHLMPLFFLGSFYESTDIGLTVAFLAATWAAVAVAQGERRAWWGFGFAVGMGFLAKFSIVVVVPAIFVALASRAAREDLKTPVPWAAAATAAVLTAPVWIWGARHDWANVLFQGTRRIEHHAPTLKFLGEFVGANLALATPFLLVGSVVALWRLGKIGGIDRWVVVAAAAAPFAFFGAISLVSRVGAHWGGPGLAVAAAAIPLVRFRGRRALIAAGAAFGLLLSLAVLAAVAFPEHLMDFHWSYSERPKRFNTGKLARLLGNEELTEELLRRFGSEETLLMTSYSDAHLFTFLSGGRLRTRLAAVADGKHGLASLYWHEPGDLIGRDVVMITPKERLVPVLADHCAEIQPLPPIEYRRDGGTIRRLLVLQCRGLMKDDGVFTR